MLYSVQCPTGSTLSAELGPLGCVDSTPAYVTSGVVVVPVSIMPDPAIPEITTADLSILLSAALGIFAMAWGFKSIGKLLFKDA